MAGNEVPVTIRARAELERRQRLRKWETESFREWLPRASPEYTWTWKHTAYMVDAVEAFDRKEILHLMLLVPPRHGKTEGITVRYPAFCIERDPTFRTIMGAYNAPLVENFSRKTRKLVRDRGVALSVEKKTASDWETARGGGVRAVGVGGGVTGRGGNLILIDDPVKSREEAESVAFRDRLFDWYRNDIYTRREPGAGVILVQTPWHFDDLAGRILSEPYAEKEWVVIRLPALAEEDDPLGREPGEALCPERYDAGALRNIERVMGEYGFSALYQMRPVPRTGSLFPNDKIVLTDFPAAKVKARVRAWDKAATQGGGAYSTGILMALTTEDRVVIEDIKRGQWDVWERNDVMRRTAQEDGPTVPIEMEQEPGSGGKESAQFSVALLAGYTVRYAPATGDKRTRAEPFASQWQAGNVTLVRAAWNGPYIGEMAQAPLGRYLDQMDASSLGFNALTRRARAFYSPDDFGTVKY